MTMNKSVSFSSRHSTNQPALHTESVIRSENTECNYTAKILFAGSASRLQMTVSRFEIAVIELEASGDF
jgi:hypothetical protein